MFTRFKTNYKTIFLDPKATVKLVEEKVNIILSPSLYWVKKLELPVKYLRDAKKLLPSIFEDALPNGKYNYSVYKKDNYFFAFAYEDKVILDALTQKGIAPSNIASIHFAQSELDSAQGAITINEEQSLYVKDGIVILVPCCWIEEKGGLNLNNLTLSKHTIVLEQYSHIVDKASLYKIGSILVVLCLIVFVEYFMNVQKVNAISDAKDELFSKYSLQATMMQNKSLLKKYETIHEKQTQIREIISYILSLKLQGGQKLLLLNFKDKSFIVEFSNVEKGNETVITKVFDANHLKYKASFKDAIWHVEITL